MCNVSSCVPWFSQLLRPHFRFVGSRLLFLPAGAWSRQQSPECAMEKNWSWPALFIFSFPRHGLIKMQSIIIRQLQLINMEREKIQAVYATIPVALCNSQVSQQTSYRLFVISLWVGCWRYRCATLSRTAAKVNWEHPERGKRKRSRIRRYRFKPSTRDHGGVTNDRLVTLDSLQLMIDDNF